jgi:spore maturation protein CgeB
MNIFVFGSSLTSSYWNGAATYYRGIYKNLHALGHQITFAEPDILQRQQNRDAGDIDYARVVVYQTPNETPRMLAEAAASDLVIKHSGVGAEDDLLERQVLMLGGGRTRVAFWDVDAPATLARVEANASDPFRACIPQYDFVFTYGGGAPVVEHYLRLGAPNCHPIYNALDPATHHPVAPDPALICDLAFVGHRLPDREKRVEDFFLASASLAPEMKFVLGGEGWGGKLLPANVRWIGHVGIASHNVVNCSARMVLNVNRDSMANVGFSPPTRVFEAAGAGACLITDCWPGVHEFFDLGTEILVASSAQGVVSWLRSISVERASEIGKAMQQRALQDHTYQLRARQLDRLLRAGLQEEVLSRVEPVAVRAS